MDGPMSANAAAQRADAHLQAGEFRESREAAVAGLRDAPEDVELLILAGRAGIELDAHDATDQLRRATELAPDRADAWQSLGEALATDGLMDDANEAFRKAVELDPANQVALSHLGHTSAAIGRDEEAVGYLSQAAQSTRGASNAAISLVDMYRMLGQHEEALVQATRIAEAEPDDLIAALDVAELSLAVGRFDDAAAAFQRLRGLDDVAGHEVYPLHGIIRVEIARAQWQRAFELVRDASVSDSQGRTLNVAAFLLEQKGEPGEQAPAREEIDAALEASLSEYRRMHADDRRLASEDLLG
jgi:tetratricopeptide (TPR) repeat protein